jgi:uncharacterized protein
VVELELIDVRVEETTKLPFLELRTLDGTNRLLPIVIGVAEAAAIKLGLEDRPTPRPLTHDLMRLLLETAGASIDYVLVSEVRDRIFFGELHLTVHGERKVISCRPSDAVALAVRCKSKMYVNDTVLAERGVTPEAENDEGEGSEELVGEFRKFIDDINPEDFR